MKTFIAKTWEDLKEFFDQDGEQGIYNVHFNLVLEFALETEEDLYVEGDLTALKGLKVGRLNVEGSLHVIGDVKVMVNICVGKSMLVTKEK